MTSFPIYQDPLNMMTSYPFEARIIQVKENSTGGFFVNLFVKADEGPLEIPVGQDVLVYFEPVEDEVE